MELSLPITLPMKDSDQPQKVRLMYKANTNAKCQGQFCKAIISVGTLCLNVKASLTVPLNRNDAVQQDFFFLSTEIQPFKHAELIKCVVSEQCRCRRGYS